jgi:hypothetical protein
MLMPEVLGLCFREALGSLVVDCCGLSLGWNDFLGGLKVDDRFDAEVFVVVKMSLNVESVSVKRFINKKSLASSFEPVRDIEE